MGDSAWSRALITETSVFPPFALHLVAMRYYYIEDVEFLDRYSPGGYHPVVLGDLLGKRYRLVHKLGFGTNSTTWLARDLETITYVAVKISTANKGNAESDVWHELSHPSAIHKRHPGCGLIMPLLNEFDVKGPNGTHRCLVSPPARASISEIQEASCTRMFDLPVARAIIAQLVLAVAYLHSRGIVHSDLHSGNILLRLPTSIDNLNSNQLYQKYSEPTCEPLEALEGEASAGDSAPPHVVVPVWLGTASENVTLPEAHIFLIDFGESFMPSHTNRDYSTAPVSVRPPDIHLMPKKRVSFAADIWTLACTMFSILGQRPLFEALGSDADWMIQEHVNALGILPCEWWSSWESRDKWFDVQGGRVDGRSRRTFYQRFEHSIQIPRSKCGEEQVGEDERTALISLLLAMLAYRPEERPTAAQILESDWMREWALPDVAKMILE